jgi:hypothetical protein
VGRKPATKGEDAVAASLREFWETGKRFAGSYSPEVTRLIFASWAVARNLDFVGSGILEEARRDIIRDDLFSYSSLLLDLKRTAGDYLSGITAALKEGESETGALVRLLMQIEDAAFELIPLLVRGVNTNVLPQDGNAPSGVTYRPSVMVQARLIDLAVAAIAARRSLEREEETRAEEELTPDARRMRRMRERKRRRVVRQVLLEVYDGDLELLRRMGLLSAAEAEKPEAIADALQAFLLGAFLMHGSEVGPWQDGLKYQRPRITSLRPTQFRDNQQ